MATVKFYLKNTKVAGVIRKDEVTISAKFTLSRTERFEIKTEEKILVKFWDSRSQCAKSNAPDHISINLYLQEFKRNLISLYRDNHKLPFNDFKNLARNKSGMEEKKTLWQAFDKYLAHSEQDKDEKTTAKRRALKGHLIGYESTGKSLDFKLIDWNFYDSFLGYLYATGMVDSSAYKYMSMVCSFLRWAAKRGFPVNPVFSEWTITKRVKKPIPLTLAELERLEAAILPRGPSIGRDYLAMESRIGQRISDIKKFDLKDFSDNQWRFWRKKGSSIKAKQVVVHFVGYCEPALDILRKHNFTLPKMSEQKINDNIKKALELAGVTTEVSVEVWRGGKCEIVKTRKCDIGSTHMGRRTFITLALQYMPPKVVKDLAGIDSYATLKHYEGNSESGILQSHLSNMQQQMKAI